MLAYGDRSRTVAPACLIGDVDRTLADARDASGLARLDLLTRALITAGELAQGAADAELEATGHDDTTPATEATMALATAVAADVLVAAGQPVGRGLDLTAALDAVRGLPLPPRLRCRTPEGFAFYAVYPEDYAAAAEGPGPSLVIGLRSIGTSLAAAAAARLGCPALTLRPCGHPFHRQLRASPALRQRLARHPGRFVVVDEGPGLSGSSFGAVADLLESLGVSVDRILFLTSHANDPGPSASPAHRARWTRSHRRTATGDVSPPVVETWFADVIGPGEVEDISGGGWRRWLPEPAWPPAAPITERLKFLLTGRDGRCIARFAGLGATGEEKLAVARRLHAAGYVPEPLALRRGFLLERWGDGKPLDPEEARSGAFLDHLARYLGFRARALSAEGDGASLAELRQMAAVNAAEMGGPDLGREVEARLAAGVAISGLVPARIDGRLHVWEWLRRPDGSFLKTDALDHAVGHDLVGCQDIAWDIAGAAVEFDLPDAEIAWLRGAVSAAAGREVDSAAVDAFRICYPAFQGGLWRMTGETGTVGGARTEVLGLEYLAALRQAVRAGPEPRVEQGVLLP